MLKAWFGLTESEQLALALVLALFLLGIAVHAWRMHVKQTQGAAPAVKSITQSERTPGK